MLRPNSALLTDAYTSPLRAQRDAASQGEHALPTPADIGQVYRVRS